MVQYGHTHPWLPHQLCPNQPWLPHQLCPTWSCATASALGGAIVCHCALVAPVDISAALIPQSSPQVTACVSSCRTARQLTRCVCCAGHKPQDTGVAVQDRQAVDALRVLRRAQTRDTGVVVQNHQAAGAMHVLRMAQATSHRCYHTEPPGSWGNASAAQGISHKPQVLPCRTARQFA